MNWRSRIVRRSGLKKFSRALICWISKTVIRWPLSGGQKQRLAVATAILSDKDVLVFDEPTSGLDYHRMLEVSNMIRKLNDANKVIIIVSHDFEFLGRTCDKIFDMEGCSKERR